MESHSNCHAYLRIPDLLQAIERYTADRGAALERLAEPTSHAQARIELTCQRRGGTPHKDPSRHRSGG